MSDTIAQKHARLIDRLYERTMSKRIEWRTNVFDKELYAEIADLTVKLVADNNNGVPIETVKVLRNSTLIESFNDEELTLETPPSRTSFETYWKMMTALRIAASRQASGAEEAVDTMLSALDDDDEF